MSTPTAIPTENAPKGLRTPRKDSAAIRLGAKAIQNMFGLDYRSIALLRIGLGILVLCHLYVSALDLRGLYSDEGTMSRSMLLANYGSVFSLHMAGGTYGFLVAIFIIQAILALMMIVGYRTRIVTVASYVLLVSLQARNPILVFGPDITLRVCFFWAMFMPLNSRFSLDAAMGRVSPPKTATYLAIPGIAYLVQFALIYIFSGLLKSGPTWTVDYTAVSLALSLEVWNRPLGVWMNQFDTLNSWLTRLTPPFEVYGPLLLVLPVWSGAGRIIALLLFTGLQLGFNLTMQMGLFGPVMIGVSVALLPAGFWIRVAEPIGRLLQRWFASLIATLRSLVSPFLDHLDRRRAAEIHLREQAPSWPRLSLMAKTSRDALLILLVVYVVFWNLGGVPGSSYRVPAQYAWVGPALGIDQLFDFFTPDPHSDDGWFVIVGTLRNGQRVNAFTGESTVSFEKPDSVYSTYLNQRWGAFLICFWSDDCNQYLEPFSRYLGLEWNRRHSGDEQISTIEIHRMHSWVGPPHVRTEYTQELLWTQMF
jgi:hypothetical protein